MVTGSPAARMTARRASSRAVAATSMETRQEQIARVNEITNDREDYPLVEAVREAASHLEFAADSDDSTANIKATSREFRASIEGVVYRSDLIRLYAVDAARSSSAPEVESLAIEIERLARANLQGDADDDAVRRAGVQQLRAQIDQAIAREDPPYATVDRWYLFNLIRLPSGEWIFRRDSSGSRGPGY